MRGGVASISAWAAPWRAPALRSRHRLAPLLHAFLAIRRARGKKTATSRQVVARKQNGTT